MATVSPTSFHPFGASTCVSGKVSAKRLSAPTISASRSEQLSIETNRSHGSLPVASASDCISTHRAFNFIAWIGQVAPEAAVQGPARGSTGLFRAFTAANEVRIGQKTGCQDDGALGAETG